MFNEKVAGYHVSDTSSLEALSNQHNHIVMLIEDFPEDDCPLAHHPNWKELFEGFDDLYKKVEVFFESLPTNIFPKTVAEVKDYVFAQYETEGPEVGITVAEAKTLLNELAEKVNGIRSITGLPIAFSYIEDGNRVSITDLFSKHQKRETESESIDDEGMEE